jgi:hypothetical protein
MALEEAVINFFEANEHDVDFLKVLFRCAPSVERVTVKLAPEVHQSMKVCKERQILLLDAFLRKTGGARPTAFHY